MNQQSKILEEGLRAGDLADTAYNYFEVDTHKSKMGEDDDVCVITLQSKDRYPAKDMMEFIEKSYDFVLDADVSAGENENGEYGVFVEILRDDKIADNITEMLYGLSKLTNITDWEFSYYKDKRKKEATIENLRNTIPSSSSLYEQTMGKFKTNEMKSFFTKTLMDNFEYENDTITVHKPFGISYKFKVLEQGDATLEESLDNLSIDSNATAEVFWLTKVMGDYNINKYGDGFLFTNEDRSLVLQRI